jgi:hypothetical protein
MTDVQVLYDDQWGQILNYPSEARVELRWYDTTGDLDGEGFNAFLATFADLVLAARPTTVLVDSSVFAMDMALMDLAWRNANIIPRYNQAGVRRFAFQVPAGMPAIGAPPAPDGPANFPTGWFASRREALSWLNG